MRLSGLVFVIVVLCLGVSPARAAQFSGEYLLKVCASDEKGREITPGGHIACQGYIAGILDYHNLIRSLDTAPSVNFCVPEEVTLYDLQHQVMSYILRNRKEHEKFIAAPGVALALYELFPCKE